MPKGCQNGTQIDATSDKKTMQKHVSKKEREIVKNHVFLKCKNMRIYRKGNQTSRFYRVGARTGNSSKNH